MNRKSQMALAMFAVAAGLGGAGVGGPLGRPEPMPAYLPSPGLKPGRSNRKKANPSKRRAQAKRAKAARKANRGKR